MWILGVGAVAIGLVAAGLGIWGVVLVVIGTQPCDPDQMCEGWALFFGIGILGAGAVGAVVAAIMGASAFVVRRGGRAVPTP